MKANVYLHIESDDGPIATVLKDDGGRRFVSLWLGDLSLVLPDYDATTVAFARVLAAKLIAAADEIDAALKLIEPAPEALAAAAEEAPAEEPSL